MRALNNKDIIRKNGIEIKGIKLKLLNGSPFGDINQLQRESL